MAVDEVLRRSHAEAGGPPTLRFYQWSQPTLSLGAGQKLPPALTPENLQALHLAVVRRPTGGRAVWHGTDLTYCLVAGVREGFPPAVTAVYRRLSRVLQQGLARLGVETETGTGAPPARFSCFAGVARGDLAWAGKKLVGSAQSWQGQSFLQHGSILLTASPEQWRPLLRLLGEEETLPLTSLKEILGALPDLTVVKEALRQALEEELGVWLQEGGLTRWEREQLGRSRAAEG